MAQYAFTFTSGDTVTPTKLNDARTISNIVNADVSATAAIAGTKIAPDFGAQILKATSLGAPSFNTTMTEGLRSRSSAAANDGDVSMESFGTQTTARHHISFSNPNGIVGSISTSGSTTAYNTSSDYRLKQNIEPLTGALETLNQLLPKTFEFKSEPGVKVDGFLAHEAQAVVPNAVTGDKDAASYQGIDMSKLVPVLVAAVQELSAKVAALGAAQS
jgi:hypothetical protein